MTLARLEELISKFAGLKIAVIGDLFLDQWFDIDPALNEPSVETNLTAWQVVRHPVSPGAAGTVLGNLHALGAGELHVVSFTGEDGEGWYLRHLLSKINIHTDHVFTVPERMTPTYMKPMFLEGGMRVEQNRLDIKNRQPTPAYVEDRLLQAVETLAPDADAIIILDQLTEIDTGVVTARVREGLAAIGAQYPGLILFADSRERIASFRNVIIKCNHLEAARAVGDGAPIPQAMERLHGITGRPVFITLGKDGIAADGGEIVPAAVQTGPIDVCGAGDATTAAIVCGLCAGATMAEAALLGNLAAGVTLRKLGMTGTASPAEMIGLYHEQFEADA